MFQLFISLQPLKTWPLMHRVIVVNAYCQSHSCSYVLICTCSAVLSPESGSATCSDSAKDKRRKVSKLLNQSLTTEIQATKHQCELLQHWCNKLVQPMILSQRSLVKLTQLNAYLTAVINKLQACQYEVTRPNCKHSFTCQLCCCLHTFISLF